ncbi:Dynamin-like GTPase that mediates homotypic ER fusion [Friedmanniomyces endolithicus]|uniref:Dynamin-like GTPase that mediates homotypic ER fusion n=1 Tax=Friedmanniomyces endolithicus TaxID=329885 RepID=A0AAN6HAM7_9PEZI|nr:Dynamin-like GTPase that mediates homotypic ER fusion [Friedmanniomyces endolithicus]KAK0780306.1 Dynamin-like GTPase that mediates homotypic ER fusion [Friedmanniomyces endolithicus]KAK0793354.1 Dynamin-like GTPase that mediates homotypic ER fusion [Friedmanniomyces endolithicus]KAK0796645.1 Dynamin-like GTPase that mediates homotypic ER fusion [Friedmanniomyces endolithicus]KAK0837187.1 Dynamin-like GTPase that mediates homotypic ER fusion [Friedmanniomyces endolithicus]
MSTLSPNGHARRDSRPSQGPRHPTAPSVMNGHFAGLGENASAADFEHGVQIVDQEKNFNENLGAYLQMEGIIRAGFNYHLISVFGSQSTGKSTLLNFLFGTQFGVMSEQERRQTTKGIWMSRNKKEHASGERRMADNILVMDVEGTDGRERGEDQDFERKSALFALATSEVLIVNIWEHQVGLYQGANMGLLKTVFEVNLQLFLKNASNITRSLLFFVIRDHLGTTPVSNLKQTLIQDLQRIWTGLSKPPGLEKSKIEDYFDFAFVALPHKILQPEKFEQEVRALGTRFREGYKDPKRAGLVDEQSEPILLPEYHRRIPADGFPIYARGVWEQIDSNKDLDLPTQQELLAQFRCDEISKEVLVPFDEIIVPLEEQQAQDVAAGKASIIVKLGKTMAGARSTLMASFEEEASRYHKAVYKRKQAELETKVDGRLKTLFQGQMTAAHKNGINDFSEAVTQSVKAGQKKGSNYDFHKIVQSEKERALKRFEAEAQSSLVANTPWSDYKSQLNLYRKDLDAVSARLRKEEMRRLATRSERWVRSKLDESVGLAFNALGSGRAGSGAPADGQTKPPATGDLWDRIWTIFTDTVSYAEERFAERAQSFDASPDEVEVGLWRLRRKSWGALRGKVDDEMMEGNLLLKLRENFEDKFRYDDDGVPRIWRPTDDIEGLYTRARESTLELVPLLARFRLARTGGPPPLEAWIGEGPAEVTAADEEDLVPIGGVDEEEARTLEEEMTVLSDGKAADLSARFKKTADGVYVEAKRSAIGGMTQIPLYFYGLLLALGWNEIVAVLRNPVYFVFLILAAAAAYVTWTLNLWGPMLRMGNAASSQGLEIFREKLREFLEGSEKGRQAIGLSGGRIGMDSLHSNGTTKSKASLKEEEVDEI